MNLGNIASIIQVIVLLIMVVFIGIEAPNQEVVIKGGTIILFLLTLPQLKPLVTGDIP